MNANKNPEMAAKMKIQDEEAIIPTVTSISELKNYRNGSIIELPPFAEDQPFFARLRRPSMLVLLKTGKIPNELLSTATKLFDGRQGAIPEDKSMQEMFDVFDVLCEASFVEPTYQELKDNGIELSDDQYMFIFNYTQRGVKALNNFRSK